MIPLRAYIDISLYQILRFAQNDNVLRSECTSVGEVRLSLDPR